MLAKGLFQYVDSAWTPIGSGSGEYDFLASKTIANYVAYNDGAVAVPVDGTGGTASYVSVAASPSPISSQAGIVNLRITKTANAAKGEGISVDFATRGLIDRAAVRVCKINILSSANFVDDDFGVYLFDVTNSRLIYPADQDVKASSFVSKQQFSFQLSPDSDSYRLIFHNQTASALAYTLDLTASIVEQKVGSGTVEIDWKSPTVESRMLYGITTATNITSYSTKYKRLGDSADISIRVTFNGAANAVGDILISLPDGLVIDLDKLVTISNTREFLVRFYTNSKQYFGLGRVASPTAFNIVTADNAGATSATWLGSTTAANNIPSGAAIGNGDYIELEITGVPIAGWSSNTLMSEDTGNRAIVFSSSGLTSTTTLPANTNTILPISLDRVRSDSVAGWDATNNWYLIQEGGDYHIDMSVLITAGSTAPSVLSLSIKRYIASTGSTVNLKTAEISNIVASKEHDLIAICTERLERGDRIYFVGFSQSQASTVYSVGGFSRASIFKLASPQTIAASEKCEAIYYDNSGQTISNVSIDVIAITKEIDSHNAYNPATGIFTCPRSGTLRANAYFYSNYAFTHVAGKNTSLGIFKNSTSIKQIIKSAASNYNGYESMELFIETTVVKGDLVKFILATSDAGQGGSINTNADGCRLSFIIE